MSILIEAKKNLNIQKKAEEVIIDSNIFNKHAKITKIALFEQIREDNPTLSNIEICSIMGSTPTTMRRIRKDLSVKSPYRYDIPIPKKGKKNNESINNNNLKSSSKTNIKNEEIKTKLGRPKKQITSIKNNINEIAGDEIERNYDEALSGQQDIPKGFDPNDFIKNGGTN